MPKCVKEPFPSTLAASLACTGRLTTSLVQAETKSPCLRKYMPFSSIFWFRIPPHAQMLGDVLRIHPACRGGDMPIPNGTDKARPRMGRWILLVGRPASKTFAGALPDRDRFLYKRHLRLPRRSNLLGLVHAGAVPVIGVRGGEPQRARLPCSIAAQSKLSSETVVFRHGP